MRSIMCIVFEHTQKKPDMVGLQDSAIDQKTQAGENRRQSFCQSALLLTEGNRKEGRKLARSMDTMKRCCFDCESSVCRNHTKSSFSLSAASSVGGFVSHFRQQQLPAITVRLA